MPAGKVKVEIVKALLLLAAGLLIIFISGCVSLPRRCNLYVNGNLVKTDATVSDFCQQREGLVELKRQSDNKVLFSSEEMTDEYTTR